jgi:thymidylate synthase (FAD)
MDVLWDRNIRVYDENSKVFVSSKIKEVFKTGVKKTYILTLEDGKTIQSTLEHKFFDREGKFRSLETFKPDDFIAVNGEFVYQSKDWFSEAKLRNIANGKGVQGIADEAGCSYHTIRKWIKIHGLQFTKHEVMSYTKIWNKDLPSEMQPMYGKVHSDETRQKQHESSRKRCEPNLYKGGESEDTAERLKIWQWQHKRKNMILKKFNSKCVSCESDEHLEIDHVIPVSQAPELAYDASNLQLLCKDCHREKSTEESVSAKQTVRYKKVVSIEYFGEEETYDLEVEHASHNYIANGIVVHNSGRYSEMPETPIISQARRQDTKNRQNSIDDFDVHDKGLWENEQRLAWDTAWCVYNDALKRGVAKEVARNVLPEGMTQSTMYMSGTIRSWIHYLDVRTGNGTQLEHIEVAKQIREILSTEMPLIFPTFL